MAKQDDEEAPKRVPFNIYLQNTKGEQVKRGMAVFSNGHEKRTKIT